MLDRFSRRVVYTYTYIQGKRLAQVHISLFLFPDFIFLGVARVVILYRLVSMKFKFVHTDTFPFYCQSPVIELWRGVNGDRERERNDSFEQVFNDISRLE